MSVYIFFKCHFVQGSCEDGWFEADGICFRISGNNTYVTWDTARERCLQQGGDLAIVDSEIKRQIIASYLTVIDNLFPDVNVQAFIGIRKFGTWQWLGGKIISTNIWHSGYPHALWSGECGALVRGSLEWKLLQTSCSYTLGYMCETHESKCFCMVGVITWLYCDINPSANKDSPFIDFLHD